MERRDRLVAAAGILLLAPAALFVTANVLASGFGRPGLADTLGPFATPRGAAEVVVSAVVVLGPLAALALEVARLLRVDTGGQGGRVWVTLEVRTAWANVAVAVVAGAILAGLAGYLVTENADCWFGAALRC
jgi:hypothetical protein